MKRDPKAAKDDILRVATKEFAEHGLSGARIDEITAKTKTSKQMIYCYFGNKGSLYACAFEGAYSRVRRGEGCPDLDELSPRCALAPLLRSSLTLIANIQTLFGLSWSKMCSAHHLAESDTIRETNSNAIVKLRGIIKCGEADGIFRTGLDPVSLHWKLSALGFLNVSNRPTFTTCFGGDLFSDLGQNTLRDDVVQMGLAYACRREDLLDDQS